LGEVLQWCIRALADSSAYAKKQQQFGPKGGFWRITKVVYEILRHTIMPFVAVEDSAIGWPFLEIIYVMMSREKLNLLDWMVSQMLDYKRDVCAPLAL